MNTSASSAAFAEPNKPDCTMTDVAVRCGGKHVVVTRSVTAVVGEESRTARFYAHEYVEIFKVTKAHDAVQPGAALDRIRPGVFVYTLTDATAKCTLIECLERPRELDLCYVIEFLSEVGAQEGEIPLCDNGSHRATATVRPCVSVTALRAGAVGGGAVLAAANQSDFIVGERARSIPLHTIVASVRVELGPGAPVPPPDVRVAYGIRDRLVPSSDSSVELVALDDAFLALPPDVAPPRKRHLLAVGGASKKPTTEQPAAADNQSASSTQTPSAVAAVNRPLADQAPDVGLADVKGEEWKQFKPQIADLVREYLRYPTGELEDKFRTDPDLRARLARLCAKELGGEFGAFIDSLVQADEEGFVEFMARFEPPLDKLAHAWLLRPMVYQTLSALMGARTFGTFYVPPRLTARAAKLRQDRAAQSK